MAVAAKMEALQCSGSYSLQAPRSLLSELCIFRGFASRFCVMPVSTMLPSVKISTSPKPFLGGYHKFGKERIQVLSPNTVTSPCFTFEYLEGWDDEYDGVIVDPESLPSSANAFASALRASLSNWKLKGKKGIWLKILEEQVDLVPIAI